MSIAIDWSKLVTKEAKAAVLLAQQSAAANLQLTALTKQATAQVAALNGRVNELTFAVDGQDPDDPDYIEPTQSEIAELPVRKAQLKSWNTYSLRLSRVPNAAGWPSEPVWPAMPEPYTNETSAIATPEFL